MRKPIIPLIDLDESRGGLSLDEVRRQLVEADALHTKWGFRTQESDQEGPIWPGSDALHEHLFDGEPIEWNRIGHFQDVTMRLIAERMLDSGCLPQQGEGVAGTTYVDRELTAEKLGQLAPPRSSYHVYCSNNNPGAAALMQELASDRGMKLRREVSIGRQASTGAVAKASVLVRSASEGALEARRRLVGRRQTNEAAKNELRVTTSPGSLTESDHMLLYLTSKTWTQGKTSDALGREVMEAMEKEVHVLLAHEMTGIGGQEARDGCEFGTFFSCPEGATPEVLLKRGIYSQIAVPLKGGSWRQASMRLLAKSVALSEGDVASASEGRDVLDLGDAGAPQMKKLTRSLTLRLKHKRGSVGPQNEKNQRPRGEDGQVASPTTTYPSTTAEGCESGARHSSEGEDGDVEGGDASIGEDGGEAGGEAGDEGGNEGGGAERESHTSPPAPAHEPAARAVWRPPPPRVARISLPPISPHSRRIAPESAVAS